MRIVGFVPFRYTTGFCPVQREGIGSINNAVAPGLWSTVRESSTPESEPIRLETRGTIVA